MWKWMNLKEETYGYEKKKGKKKPCKFGVIESLKQ